MTTSVICSVIVCLALIAGIFVIARHLDRRDQAFLDAQRTADLEREREKLAAYLFNRRNFTMRGITADALGIEHDAMPTSERIRIATRLRTEFGCHKLGERECRTDPYLWIAPQPPRVLPTSLPKERLT